MNRRTDFLKFRRDQRIGQERRRHHHGRLQHASGCRTRRVGKLLPDADRGVVRERAVSQPVLTVSRD
jgi:hypothetical protein